MAQQLTPATKRFQLIKAMGKERKVREVQYQKRAEALTEVVIRSNPKTPLSATKVAMNVLRWQEEQERLKARSVKDPQWYMTAIEKQAVNQGVVRDLSFKGVGGWVRCFEGSGYFWAGGKEYYARGYRSSPRTGDGGIDITEAKRSA